MSDGYPQNAPDTVVAFPGNRIAGGDTSFYQTVAGHIAYPRVARDHKTVGTTIAVLTVSPQGELASIDIINTLGTAVDKVVRQAVERTRDMWLADETEEHDVVIFVPFTFAFHGSPFLQHTNKPPFITEDIKVVGSPSVAIEQDADLADRANRLYQKEKFKRAIHYLNELIRRNPYDKNLYLMRGTAHYRLGQKELGCKDLMKIKDFLRESLPPAARAMCER